MDHIITHRGVKIKINQMSHQHMSNWFWYSKLIMEDTDLNEFWENKLNQHFDGKILLYKPHDSYPYEMAMLKEKGMVDEYGNIFFDNQQIGYITKG